MNTTITLPGESCPEHIYLTKANDMSGVFTPTIRDYSALVACASSVLVIIAFVFSAVPDAERMARDRQEVHVTW